MMNDFHDDGFGLFSDDPQEQLFYYYAYTQMTGDDPFELFDDELPQDMRRRVLSTAALTARTRRCIRTRKNTPTICRTAASARTPLSATSFLLSA